MKHALTAVSLAVAVLSVAPVVGQATPDFTGTWTYDASRSSKTSVVYNLDGSSTGVEVPTPPPPVFGSEFTVTQDAHRLTLSLSLRQVTGVPAERAVDGWNFSGAAAGVVHYSLVYQLDGSASRNENPSSVAGGPTTATTSTAMWKGDMLVVATRIGAAETPALTHSFRLDPDGRLIIDTSISDAPPRHVTTVYVRK